MAVQFFYDGQIRRFLLQFNRMVSNFQVQFGTTDNNTGKLTLQTIPVFYGDGSRQAATILKGNSENTLSAVPAMAFYISGLQYDRARVQDPSYIGKLNIRERKVDPVTGMLTHEQGDTYTVERQMPVPYLLTLKLDIWTSNTEQKLQIIEQISTLFNPSLELQSTDNYVDWTSLTWVLLTETVWSSRTVPVGTEDPIDVATLTFEMPIWLSPPAKVTRMGVIQKIVSNVYDGSGNLNLDIFDPDNLMSHRVLTVLGYSVALHGNRVRLLKHNETQYNRDLDSVDVVSTTPNVWRDFINEYGALNPGISQIRLDQPSGATIVGTVAYDPTDDSQLLFNVNSDTLPVNTLDPINSVIDPQKVNVSSILLNNDGTYKVTAGTRFLIINDINSYSGTEYAPAWKPNGHPLIAKANDIIQYDGQKWHVVFDSATQKQIEYVTNLTTQIQLFWDGQQWAKSYEGLYREDSWSIVL